MKSPKKFNLETALKILLLLGYAAFFLYIVFSDAVSMYVHPRIIPYIIFAAAVMTAIALLSFSNLSEPTKKKKPFYLLFFAVPLLMAVLLPAQFFDAGSGIAEGLQLTAATSSAASETTSEASSEISSEASVPTESSTAESAESIYSAPESVETVPTDSLAQSAASQTDIESQEPQATASEDVGDDVIVMDSDNFYEWIDQITNSLDDYIGRKIVITGFVYKGEGLGENRFVPARLMMVCCAADMVTVGLLCNYDQTAELEENAWVKVTGIIGKSTYEGEEVPEIEVSEVEPTEKPDREYVYPYF